MASHVWSVLCDRPIVDAMNQKISLIDCIDRLWVTDESLSSHGDAEGKAVATAFWVASMWSRAVEESVETFETRLSIRTPSGQMLPPTPTTEVSFKEGSLRARTLVQMGSFPLRGPGDYQFLVRLKQPSGRWKTVASLPLLLSFGQPS